MHSRTFILIFTNSRRNSSHFGEKENIFNINVFFPTGINNLIHRGVFLDAYPLHDGPVLNSSSDTPVNQRQRLQKDWASFSCIFRYQPMNAIRDYFGEKVEFL